MTGFSIDQCREALLAEQESTPEDLRPLLTQEINELTTTFHAHLQASTEFDSDIDIQEYAQMKIKKWTQEKLRALTYDRYCELMETQGFDPISLMKFSKPSRGARISTITDNSPSKRFQMLEQKQFAVGDTVKIGEKGGGQIIKINPGVSLTVQTSDGPRTFKALDYIQKIEV